jgi:hypothetical protein
MRLKLVDNSKKMAGKKYQPPVFFEIVVHDKSVSFFIVVILSLVVELPPPPLSKAMMMIKSTAPPTIHIQGCTVIDPLCVVVVVEELEEVTELSWANTIAWRSVNIIRLKEEI